MTKTKKNIMRQFRLTELSAVDIPAQQGARMAIMKNMRKAEPEPSPHDHPYTPTPEMDEKLTLIGKAMGQRALIKAIDALGNNANASTNVETADAPTMRAPHATDAGRLFPTSVEDALANLDQDQKALVDLVRAAWVEAHGEEPTDQELADAIEAHLEEKGITMTKTAYDFDKRVADLTTSGMGRQQAMRKARQEDPSAFAAQQHIPTLEKFSERNVANAAANLARRQAINKASAPFAKRVSDLISKGMKRQAALQTARREDPAGFEAFQNAGQ